MSQYKSNVMEDNDFELGKEGLLYTYAQILFYRTFRYLKIQKNIEIKPDNIGIPRVFTWNIEKEYEFQNLKAESIIYTSFFLEAYINDYSFRYLDRNVTESLDKLPTLSKYLIVTKLVWNDDILAGSHYFEFLKNTFRLRNKLAHPKSSNNGSLLDIPKIFDNINGFNPEDNVEFILELLQLFAKKNPRDEVTVVLIKQIYAWLDVAKSDLDFYPIPNNAGL